MLSTIKAKLISISMAVIGILAVLLSVSKARNERLKREAKEQELEDEKAAREQSNRATEALIRGVENEQTNTNPRAYDFHD